MAAIEWTADLELGIPLIDEQHKELVRLINILDAAPHAADSVVDELLDYVSYHFSEEEGLMARAGYVGLSEHAKTHEAFIAKLCEFDVAARSENPGAGRDLHYFLVSWLMHHIMHTDTLYVSAVIPATD